MRRVRRRVRILDDDGVPPLRACLLVSASLALIASTRLDADDILVVLHGPLSIDHLELRGHAVVDGSPRFERIVR